MAGGEAVGGPPTRPSQPCGRAWPNTRSLNHSPKPGEKFSRLHPLRAYTLCAHRDVPDDTDGTDNIEVVNAEIEVIDVRDVAWDVADAWDSAPGRSPPRFDPRWRQRTVGTSCYADVDTYGDLQEGKQGDGALTLIAHVRGSLTSSGGRSRGDDY